MPARRSKQKAKSTAAGRQPKRSSPAAAAGSKRSRQVETEQQPSKRTKRQRKTRQAHAELLDYDEDVEYDAPNITSSQLKDIALQNQQSKRQNTQRNYGVQERKFQWYLTHDDNGKERVKAFSPNLLDPSAPDVLMGFLQWLSGGMPGYEGRANTNTDKLVGGSSPSGRAP
jgi:hypothetical protein